MGLIDTCQLKHAGFWQGLSARAQLAGNDQGNTGTECCAQLVRQWLGQQQLIRCQLCIGDTARLQTKTLTQALTGGAQQLYGLGIAVKIQHAIDLSKGLHL